MESTNAYLLSSPGSILVALVTFAFVIHRAWPRLVQLKQNDKLAQPIATSNSVSDLSVSKEPEVPEGWWNGRDVFELERRALFSQTWIYLAHSAQFSKPGAYQSFDLAGFPVFLIRGKDDKIRAFHNVCRHRAYTITRKETGASTVLGCRYHGWSYDTTGRLVKAPQFDDVPGFDKSQNSLFEVHTHTTDHGLVFVDLNAGKPSIFDGDVTLTLEEYANTGGLNGKSIWVTGQTLSGDFNWKMAMKSSRLGVFTEELERAMSEISGPSALMKVVRYMTQKDSKRSSTLFPTTFLYAFAGTELGLALSFFPSSETRTQIRYDLFSRLALSQDEVQKSSEILRTTTDELVREVESEYQTVLKRKGFPGEFNTSGTREIISRLQQHTKLERIQGGPILPAMRRPEGSSLFQQAEKLCKELDCMGGGSQDGTSSTALDW